MFKADNVEGAYAPSGCAGEAKFSASNNCSTDTNSIPHSLNEDDYSTSQISFQKETCDNQQKRFSWLEGSVGFSTRTTASNSTEISPPNQTIAFNILIGAGHECSKRESISVQNAVFSEEEASSSTSRTQSQDFTPFFNLLQNKKNSTISKQPEDWSSEQILFNMSLQNNLKEELSLLEDKLINMPPIKSENIIPECTATKISASGVEDEHLNSLVLEEINKINIQENEDEVYSPTLKLRRVKAQKDNCIEQRIYRWLDINGIFQVDPSSKREEYYQQRRENLIQVRKVSKPLEDEMKQSSGSLNLCKISSSPLFNRRKLINKVPIKKKNFLEINDDDDQQSCNIIQNSSDQLDQETIPLSVQHSEDIDIRKQTFNKNTKETSDTIENNISLKVPSKQQICSNVSVSSTSSIAMNGECIKSTCYKDVEQIEDIDEDHNNILPQQKTKIFHQSIKLPAGTTFEKNHSSGQYFASTMSEQCDQENYDFINKKPPPNLDLEKNQKRRSLKQMNSIPSFSTIGIPLQ